MGYFQWENQVIEIAVSCQVSFLKSSTVVSNLKVNILTNFICLKLTYGWLNVSFILVRKLACSCMKNIFLIYSRQRLREKFKILLGLTSVLHL